MPNGEPTDGPTNGPTGREPRDLVAEAHREWRQRPVGTAATPPWEWVQSYVLAETLNMFREELDAQAARVAQLEADLALLRRV